MHGASGSGKSTLARAIGARLGLPVFELDALRHQAGWVPLPDELFVEEATEIAAGDAWVADGNYSLTRPALWARAQRIVVLDLPRSLVLRRLLARTLRRGIRREELWNGNRESLRDLLSIDPERNVLLWSFRTHRRYREEVPGAARASGAEVVVLRSPAEVAEHLAGLRPQTL